MSSSAPAARWRPPVGSFCYYPNPHYSSPTMPSSTPQLNPPMYLARVVSVKNDQKDVLLELRWFIQTASSLAFTSKTAVGPFVETNHTWSASSTAVLRIPSVCKPIQQFPKGFDHNNNSSSSSSSSRQASSAKTNPSLEHIKGDVFILPKGWGIKQLQEGLVAHGTAQDDGATAAGSKGAGATEGESGFQKGGAAATSTDIGGDNAGSKKGPVGSASTSKETSKNKLAAAAAVSTNDSSHDSKTMLDSLLFAPAQARHEIFTGLSDHYKVRGGKSLFGEKGSLVGAVEDEKNEGQWRSTFTLSGGGVLDLGLFNDKLSALIAHDQAARHYYAEEHKDEEEEDGKEEDYVTNFGSDADARRWWKSLKSLTDGKKRRREQSSSGQNQDNNRTSNKKPAHKEGGKGRLKVATERSLPPPVPPELIRQETEPVMGVEQAANGLFTAKVTGIDGRDKLLGYYESEKSAGESYDRHMMLTLGPNKARLNYETSRVRSRRGGHRGHSADLQRSPMSSPTSSSTTATYSKKQMERMEHEKDVADIMKNAEPAVPSGGIKYRGVSYMYKCARWRACITVKGKPQQLGLYRMAKEAALAYDEAALKLKGEHAVTNFDLFGTINPTCTMGAFGGLYGEHLDRGSQTGSMVLEGSGGGGGADAAAGGLDVLAPLVWPRLGDDYQVGASHYPTLMDGNEQENGKKSAAAGQNTRNHHQKVIVAASMQAYVDPSASSASSASSPFSTTTSSNTTTTSSSAATTSSSTSSFSSPATANFGVGTLVTTPYGTGTVVHNEDVSSEPADAGVCSIQVRLPWSVVHVRSMDDVTPANTVTTTTAPNPSLSSSSASSIDPAVLAAWMESVQEDDATPKDTHYGTLLTSDTTQLPPIGVVQQTAANVGKALASAAAREGHWTPEEKKTFEQAMYENDKDFERCSMFVKTKTSRDCAEYYYCHWKLARAHRRWKQVRDEITMQAAVQEHQRTQDQVKASRSLALQSPLASATTSNKSGGGKRGSSKSNAERYCVCHGPGVGFMLGCTKCELWFHGACVGLGTEEGVIGDNDDFVCGPCSQEGEPTLIQRVVDETTKNKIEKRIGLWPRRVVLWDNRRKVLVSGVKAPTVKTLVEVLTRHRQLHVYYGEKVEYEEVAAVTKQQRGGKGVQGGKGSRGGGKGSRGGRGGRVAAKNEEEDDEDSDDDDDDSDEDDGSDEDDDSDEDDSDEDDSDEDDSDEEEEEIDDVEEERRRRKRMLEQERRRRKQEEAHQQRMGGRNAHGGNSSSAHHHHHHSQQHSQQHGGAAAYSNQLQIIGNKRPSSSRRQTEPVGAKKARARRRVFHFCKQLDPWLRDDSINSMSDMDGMSSGSYGRGSGGYRGSNGGGGGPHHMPPPATSASTFVHPSSSSISASASIGSSWSDCQWRAPIGGMSAFDNHVHNIEPLEPLPILDPKLPVNLQMKELIQRVQVCFFFLFLFSSRWYRLDSIKTLF